MLRVTLLNTQSWCRLRPYIQLHGRRALCLRVSGRIVEQTRRSIGISKSDEITIGIEDEEWAFKYPRRPCTSPCPTSDKQCLMIEAVFQNVFQYPRIPGRVYRVLCAHAYSIERITGTAEALVASLGTEVSFQLVKGEPRILTEEPQVLFERAEYVRNMLGLRRGDISLTLLKNPMLLMKEPQEIRDSYDMLNEVFHLNRDGVRAAVQKYPRLLTSRRKIIEEHLDILHRLCSASVQWQLDLECISPSLLVYFLGSSMELRLRMEFLIINRESLGRPLHDLFKMSKNCFESKNPGFRRWASVRKQKLAQIRARGLDHENNLRERKIKSAQAEAALDSR